MCELPAEAKVSHTALGACVFMSFSTAGVISLLVMSTWPVTNDSVRVDRLVTMRYSMASRYGKPFFQ